MKLSIIIVNYNTKELTSRCIESIYSTFYGDFEIIVVDNNSVDNSARFLKGKFPRISIIENRENEGFGRANNKGVKVAQGEYVLLLNSDMIVQEQTIEECLKHIEKYPEIGALGCKLLNEDGSTQKSVYYYTGEYLGILKDNILLDKIKLFKPKEIKAIMGAFMLFRKEDFYKAGGFDPDFFLYSEELELCNRLLKLGKTMCYYTDACAIHKHQGSSTDSKSTLRQRFLSHALMIYKIKGIAGYYLYLIVQVFNITTNFMCMWFVNKSYRKDYIKGFFYLTSNFYSIFGRMLLLPFKFSRNRGDGRKMLKY
jgi:GT2 family glycosyltransferase